MATFQERMSLLYEEAKDVDHRLTQGEYASRFGATRNQLKGWLDGRGEPNIGMMKIIATTHEVSVSWLVGETNMRNLTGTTSQKVDDNLDDLPTEAIRSIKEFIELMRIKYNRKS